MMGYWRKCESSDSITVVAYGKFNPALTVI